MNNPKITVLMPVYNAEKYLKEAIDSILGQTFSDFEFIIVNDGSTDSSREIILSYKDRRIRLIDNEYNMGLIKSLNKGLDYAKGKYIARMDADDVSLPERLKKQINFMERHNIDFCGTEAYIIDERGRIIGSMKRARPDNELPANILSNSTWLYHPSMIIKREAIGGVNLYSENYLHAEDFDLWSRLFLNNRKASVLPEKLLKYRRTPMQITVEGSPNRQIYYNNALLIIKDYIKNIICFENKKIVKEDICDAIAAFFLRYQTGFEIEQKNNLNVNDIIFFRKAFQKKFSHINNSLIGLDRRIVASAGYLIRDKGCDLLLRLRLLRLFIVGKLIIYHHDGSVIKGAVRAFYKSGWKLGARIYRYFLRRAKSKIYSLKLSRRYAIEKKRLPFDLDVIRQETLIFIEKMRCKPAGRAHGEKWSYYFSASGQKPILYASIFAVLTHSLYGLFEKMKSDTKKQWAESIKSYQSDDGLFQDPVIACSLAKSCSWWGWEHLTLHALMALTALGQTAKKELAFVKKFYHPAFLTRWLDTRNWDTEPANVSNEIQNVGVALQYARDFHQDPYAQKALDVMFEWLDSNQNSENGSWGNCPSILVHKGRLSQIVQTGYHIWLLYFYDKRSLKYSSQIIDLLLQTQNKIGGFGVSLNSSACEDIDSIDPLIRLMNITDYRKEDILKALERALPWVLVNRNSDGGWVFRRNESAQIGPEGGWSAKVDESAMFPIWFRILTLAYLSRALPESFKQGANFHFVRCPGHQFL